VKPPFDPLLLFLEVMQQVDPAPRSDRRAEVERERCAADASATERRMSELDERLRRKRAREAFRRVRWEPTQAPHAAEPTGTFLRLVVGRESPHGPVLEVYGPASFSPLYELASTLIATEPGAHVVKWEVARARR
jgi:hypothetical protein